MDLSSSRRKTFKSNTSFMHGRNISFSADEDRHHEEQPILSDHRRDSADPPEIIVNIEPAAPAPVPPPIRSREASLDSWKDESMQQKLDLLEDPPSKLINQFLHKQKAGGGDCCLDVDLEMEELRNDRNNNNNTTPHSLPPLNAHDIRSKSHRLVPSSRNSSFHNISADDQEKYRNEINETPASSSSSSTSSDDDRIREENQSTMNRRRSMNATTSGDAGCTGGEGQVLRCTSSLQRKYSALGRAKTKSRLLDPAEYMQERRSEILKSGQVKSEGIGSRQDEEEEDPLFDEDLPEEYKKKSEFNKLTFAQWISLILIVTALICTTSFKKWKIKTFRGLHLWKWEVLILVLICGRLVSGWGIRLIVFFFERNFLLRKKVLYFVYGVKRSMQNFFWFLLVLIAWHSMFDQAMQWNNEFLYYVNKVLLCMIVGTFSWLVKTLMVKSLASTFHVSTFFDRIQESLFNQYVIEVLSGPPHIEIRKQQQEEERTMAEVWRLQNAGATLPPDLRPPTLEHPKSGKIAAGGGGGGGLPPRPTKGVSFKFSDQTTKNQEAKSQDELVINIDNLEKMNTKNVSAWNMKRFMKVVKKGVLITLDERVQYSSEGDDAATQIRSENEAKCAARKIFHNVAKPKAKYIYLEDLMRFLEESQAVKTLNLVEGSPESGKISKSSLKSWVVNAFIERRALALTLDDTKTAVNQLHRMVNVLVSLILIFTFLVILGIATSKFLLYLSSQIVVVAFIFGNMCKTVFEAIIFVFVIHPFDVGDRCEIDGVQLIVEEMNILTTVFLRYDNLKVIYPNVTLATRPIGNFYRSPEMGDSVDFAVHIATPAEKISIVKQKIITYLESKPDYWFPQPSVVLMNIEQLHMLKLSVWIRQRINFQNMGDRWKRRALLVEEMVRILKEHDIEYRLYPLDINVRSMPQITSTRMPHGWGAPPPAS